MAFETYTKLDNALIVNALCKITLSGYQWRILMYIFRQTFGWNRLEFRSSLRTIENETGIDYRNVIRTLKTLEAKLIISTRKGKEYTIVTINPDYITWRIEENPGLFPPMTAPASEAAAAATDRAQAVEALTPDQEDDVDGLKARAAFWEKVGGRRVMSLETSPCDAGDIRGGVSTDISGDVSGDISSFTI